MSVVKYTIKWAVSDSLKFYWSWQNRIREVAVLVSSRNFSLSQETEIGRKQSKIC